MTNETMMHVCLGVPCVMAGLLGGAAIESLPRLRAAHSTTLKRARFPGPRRSFFLFIWSLCHR